MRKFMLILMAMSVLLISGCGGSIYDDDSSTEKGEYEDNYSAKDFLTGRWVITEGTGEATSISKGSDVVISLIMNSAQMNFSNVVISGDTGTAILYYAHKWKAFDDSEIYLDEFGITSYRSDEDIIKSQVVNLTHTDVDNWRVDDADGNIIMIEFTSPYSIATTWEGFAHFEYTDTSAHVVSDDYHYTLECSFRKQ